jgi:GT2 family glycosyltransferase/glycosyltransferase involved in cell wall biosynthesis
LSTVSERRRREAEDAVAAARLAGDSGDAGRARAWLERAHRLVPGDVAVAMLLAQARIADRAPREAAALLESVVTEVQLREAWWTLASVRLAIGDTEGAAAALGEALRRFRLPEPVPRAAAAIARAAFIPGWCGLGPRGPVAVTLPGAAPARRRRHGAGVAFTSGERALLGSPLDPSVLARVEGAVWTEGAELVGWAWHPADPDRDPVLTVSGGGGARRVIAADRGIQTPRPLAQARGFRVVLGARDAAGPVSVTAGGRALAGSPLDPFAEHRAARVLGAALARAYPLTGRSRPMAPQPVHADVLGLPARAPSRPKRPVVVVLPVHGTGDAANREATLACLAALDATAAKGTALVIVDDASRDAALVAELVARARRPGTTLIRLRHNLGFCEAANAGLRAAWGMRPARDVVLLNSDTIPAPGWVEMLREAVHAAPDIGTASPLSNDATILSYPRADKRNAMPEDVAAMGRLAAASGGASVPVPTGVGFCLYLRRECLGDTGVLRGDLFAQGYGEENDFCRRAAWLGWRHVAVPRAYVAHVGGGSFGAATAALIARNSEAMERLHPGYAAAIARWIEADPLAQARRALDESRLAARIGTRLAARVGERLAARVGERLAARKRREAVLLVTHDDGGGVERAVMARAAAIAADGGEALLLRPVLLGDGEGEPRYRAGFCRLDDAAGGFPNLVFRVPGELAALQALLRRRKLAAVEIHHLLGHDRAVADIAAAMGVPLAWHAHDYACVCPRVTFSLPDGRYCGEPAEVAACEACIADNGRRDGATMTVAALRAASLAAFSAGPVVVPSGDVASRLARHLKGISARVARPEDDGDLPPLERPPPAQPRSAGRRRIAVPGAIGPEKGYDVLLACARDAAARNLDLEFVVVGHTLDDTRLMQTGRVWVTGRYEEAEGEALLRAQGAALAFIPSTCPETWCFALSLAWRAGLVACGFDLGAQGERIRATGRGFVLPLGLPAGAINSALMSAEPLAMRRG